jgi:hypothetical protein
VIASRQSRSIPLASGIEGAETPAPMMKKNGEALRTRDFRGLIAWTMSWTAVGRSSNVGGIWISRQVQREHCSQIGAAAVATRLRPPLPSTPSGITEMSRSLRSRTARSARRSPAEARTRHAHPPLGTCRASERPGPVPPREPAPLPRICGVLRAACTRPRPPRRGVAGASVASGGGADAASLLGLLALAVGGASASWTKCSFAKRPRRERRSVAPSIGGDARDARPGG